MPLKRLPLTAVALCLSFATPLAAQQNAGSYLAGRQAILGSNYAAAAQYYSRAVARDPKNPVLLENALTSTINLGQYERALPIARQLKATAPDSQIANLVLLMDQMQRGKFDDVIAGIDNGLDVMPLISGQGKAWAEVGRGQMTAALALFDQMIATDGLANFALYHKALALASVGDFEGADKIFAGDPKPLRLDRRGIEARIQVLSQLERNDDALELIALAFGPEPAPVLAALKARLESGETIPFTAIRNAQDGMAEVFYMVANVLSTDANPGYALLFSRSAEHLNPTHVDAILLSAEFLDDLEQYDLATKAYDTVPRTHPAFYQAELGRAEALRRDGRGDTAIEVLEQLAETHGDLAVVHNALGDLNRQQMNYGKAAAAYDRAIALFDDPKKVSWRLYYVRGIANEREGHWDKAEADFRMALAQRPDEPRVLNYLGYSLLEKGEQLDEALAMIEKAVEGSPDSGYIIDSLGWAFYNLGRYEEAVPQMERAVALMPLDAVVNDHVGDVYWAVGREREARFQWRRALSLDPDQEDADRIRRKLEVGLDVVLEEEGAAPLSVANDG